MAIGDPYISRVDFKNALEITADDEDDWIDRCLRGASRSIERRTGWPTFWKAASAQTTTVSVLGKVLPVRSPYGAYTKVLLRSGVASATSFSVAGYSTAVLMPEDALAEGRPADAIRLPQYATFGTDATLTYTAIPGWPEVPGDIEMACHLQASRLYKRKASPEGYAGSAEWGVTRIPALDPDVLAILKGGGYMRAGIG